MSTLVVTDRFGREVQRPTQPSTHARPKELLGKDLTVRVGDKYGNWAGRDLTYLNLPGGAMLTFDLSRLTLADFRSMRDHYQINASLTVLSFVLHQIDWHIECEKQEIADVIEKNLRDRWTTMIRGLSTAFWAGYSPQVINFANEPGTGNIIIDKFKDLVPEECNVNWKEIKGYAPPGKTAPTFLEYDGIIQNAWGWAWEGGISRGTTSANMIPIPPENSLWYPLMMENGDYYGRKLLKPAFPAWYFSQIMHLFANRYYERFGEPTAVGRAAFDAEVSDGEGNLISGKKAMENVLSGLRNRSSVVLPSDRDPVTKEFDYELEYLESQMRGADFERYMSRLDEEMSLAVFTPMLLFRTASVGSYNLGQQHFKIFLWMLNSVAGDLEYYIQNYVVDRLRLLNWGEDAPRAYWKYRKLGKDDVTILGQVVSSLVGRGAIKPDLEELGTAIGLKLEEIEGVMVPPAESAKAMQEVTGPPGDPNNQKDPKDKDNKTKLKVAASYPASLSGARDVLEEAVKRVYATVVNGRYPTGFGFRGRFTDALLTSGADTATATRMTNEVYGSVNAVLADMAVLKDRPEEFRDVLGRHVDAVLDAA